MRSLLQITTGSGTCAAALLYGLYTSETSPLLCVLTSVALPVALYVEYKLLTLIPKRK
jgi:hypothetical protein